MTVRELIERLEGCDPEAEVVVLDYTANLASVGTIRQGRMGYNADEDFGEVVEVSAEPDRPEMPARPRTRPSA